MFKVIQAKAGQSAQHHLQQRLLKSEQSLQAATKRGIRAPAINLPFDVESKKRRRMYDVHGQTIGRLGIVNLNKEHRFNTLSPSFCHEVSRGIGSMYEDRLTRAIYVTPASGKHWSNGTDFRTMIGMKKENNYERLADYLQQIYQLQTQIAKTNKPIVATAPGHAFNSGATMLASCGFPLMTVDSQMAFNECTFGFVPHSGATYYLSRLPSEFGTFLALTGMPIHGTDAAKLGLVDGLLQNTKHVYEDVADVIYAMGHDPREFHSVIAHHEERIKRDLGPQNDRWLGIHERLKKNQALDIHAQNKAGLQSARDWQRRPRDFEEAAERLPSSVAEAEMFYNETLRNESRGYQMKGEGYLEPAIDSNLPDFDYQRIYQPITDYIKSHIGHQYKADRTVAFQHMEMIGRCFYPSSIDEIKQNLRDEGSSFALKCLDAMERNSDLSMKLALQMLRQANSLDYVSCLNMEVKVASKMIETDEFDIGVNQVLLSPKVNKSQKHPNAPVYPDNASSLDPFFEGASWAKDVNVGAMEHALLPTRHHYERFTDQVRLWINEESTHQDELRTQFDYEAKQALHEIGIDVRDKGLTMQSAREAIAAQLAMERRNEVQGERMTQMMTDSKLRNVYFNGVNKEVAKLKSQEKSDFQKTVDACITKTFENAYIKRLQTMFDKSREAQTLERRRMFIRLKRFLFKSRCLSQGSEEVETTIKRLQNYSYKFPHLSEKWDTNWRHFSHPLIEKSPLHQLSKAIGRVSLSPIELTREYLTNPQMRDQLSTLTIDKKELLKIQDDIYANPQKYEAMFTKQERIDWGLARQVQHKDRHEDHRLSDRQFWHSMLNDGTESVENWPFYSEYVAYKGWFDNVEDKALDTLKTAVAQLLQNFENPDNKVFDGKNKSKKNQLEKLLSQMQGLEDAYIADKQKNSVGKKTKKSRKITSSKRDIDQISQLLDQAVSEDIHLSKLVQPSDAPGIRDFQEKARTQLLQMLEIVLLDKYADTNDADQSILMKQRLATLMTPEGMKRDELTHQQLKLIDTYLIDESGKAALKSAINLIKPAYLEFLSSLLDEASVTLGQEMNIAETQHHVMVYNHMFKTNPNLAKSQALQRLWSYSKQRDNNNMLFAGVPQESPTFKQRHLMNQFGHFETTEHFTKESIEAQKAKVEKRLEIQQAAVAQLEANLEQMEKDFDKEADEGLVECFDNPKGDVRQLEVFWHERDQDSLHQLDNIMQESVNWVIQHKYEIENHFGPLDYLKMYQEAILDQGLDMNVTLKIAKAENFLTKEEAAGRPQESWQQLAEAAKYLVDIREQAKEFVAEQMPDFSQSEAANTDDHKSLWELALKKKKDYLKSRQNKTDRTQIIRNELADFAKLQSQEQGRQELVQKLEHLADTQSSKIRDLITEALNAPKTYINFAKLADEVMSGSDPTRSSNLADFIEVDKLVQDVRSKNGPSSLTGELMSTCMDVQSIEDAKVEADRNTSYTQVEKAQVLKLLDHCSEQMQFVKNDRRQGVTLGQYLSGLHTTSLGAFQDQSSSILRKKLTSALGSSINKGSNVDWEVNGVRTQPVDHLFEADSAASMLKDITSGKESIQQVDEKVKVFDSQTGITDSRSLRDQAQIHVLRQARNLTALHEDMDQYKNFYENELLKALMLPGSDKSAQEAQQRVIDEYTALRMKTCMLNEDFATQVHNSDNGHLFMKVLQERVVDELGLTKEADENDMLWKTMFEKGKEFVQYDAEAAYNMQDVSNTESMGFDNLASRSAIKNGVSAFESSHENVFDKLLADYYLSQRGDYAETNKTMAQLTEVFEKKIANKKSFRDKIAGENIRSYKLEQDMDKAEKPTILARHAKSIFELDVLTHQAIQGGKTGLCDSLRGVSISETDHPDYYKTQVPEFFDRMDVRQKPEVYVTDKLQQVVDEAFETRGQLERNMSRRELVAFDKVLAKYLEPENLLKRLESSIEEDYSLVFQGREMIEQAQQNASAHQDQLKKEPNMQREYTKSIKDEDALYKRMALGAVTEMKYKTQVENPDNLNHMDKVYMFSSHTFERLYMEQLEKDAKSAPRTIDAADYEPKFDDLAEQMPYLDQKAREEKFFEDHTLFLENKKEQQDRIKLFYILEQFYEHSRENPDKMSKAQDHMKEYFSDPDNTFFFDKNKIQ